MPITCQIFDPDPEFYCDYYSEYCIWAPSEAYGIIYVYYKVKLVLSTSLKQN